MLVSINEIKINPGRREATLEEIQELARSISEVGLLNPITISQANTLIAGLHRLEAAEMLGWTEIECNVLDLEGLRAELAEIDENFVRTPLSSAEQGDVLSRRKQIYEALHPEKRHGGDRKSAAFKSPNCRVDRVKSFAEDTAEKLGISPRTVERRVWVAEHLTQTARDVLRSSEVKLTHQALEKLAHLEPGQQEEAAQLLAERTIKSIDEYPLEQETQDADALTNLLKNFKDYTRRFLCGMETFRSCMDTFADMSQEQLAEVWSQIEDIHTTINGFAEAIKGECI